MTDNDIVRLIKSKIPKIIIAKNIEDDYILYSVKEINQAVMNYCNIPKVPAALTYTISNMAIDLILYEIARDAALSGDPDAQLDASRITSLNIGDTLIKFGKDNGSNRQEILSSHKAKLDDIVMNYREQLNRFRRLL